VLDDLPLTPSGKLDRRSLPDPRPSSGGRREAPLTTTECALTNMVEELLDLRDIGPGDALQELGVDSIFVVLLRARIRKELRADIRLAAIVQAETVRQLAIAVDGAPTVQVEEETAVVDPEAPVPASEQQRQFWLLNRIADGRPLYHEGLVATVDGDVDEHSFAIAVRDLAARHPVLRSVLTLKGGQLTAEPRPADEVPIAVRSIPPERLDREVRAALRQPFDLGSELPLRAVALRTAPHAWALVVVVHHAATDGWSTQRIVDDFTTSYDQAARGRSPMRASAAAGYAAYAGWQLTLPQDGALAWWVRTLEGVDPVLVLRNARPRPSRPSYHGGRLRLSLSERMQRDVRRLAREERTSPYMVLLAAFAAEIGELAGRDDLIIGVPAANRLLPEHQNVVGPFVNTLPLRLNVDALQFPDLVRRTRDAMVAALERQHVTVAKIVSALGLERSRSPLVQVLFTAAPRVRPPLRLGEAPVEWQFDPSGSDAAIMDLNVTVHDDGDRIRADLEYATDMFDPESAREILDNWTRRLSAGTGNVDQFS
jgi:aryl carrier-like protein